MAEPWYYSKQGQRVGPVSEEQLRQLASSGQVQPTDLVWKKGLAQWTEARKVKGLFPTAPAANPPSAAPVPMAEQWYYSKQGQRTGPVSEEQLKQMVASGQVQPTDLVWKNGMAQWGQAGQVFPPPPPDPNAPPPLDYATATTTDPTRLQAGARSGGGRMAIPILTLIAGFLSLFVGGCTGALSEGVAKFGENVSNLQSQYGSSEDAARIRREAAGVRSQGSTFVMLGLLQAMLGVTGGIYAFQKYNSTSDVAIAGKRFKRLTLAGLVILVAAVISLHNCIGFITAGVLNGIAGVMVLLRARNLGLET
jgi:hypothetical protein